MAAEDSGTHLEFNRPEDGQAGGRAPGVEGVGARKVHIAGDIW